MMYFGKIQVAKIYTLKEEGFSNLEKHIIGMVFIIKGLRLMQQTLQKITMIIPLFLLHVILQKILLIGNSKMMFFLQNQKDGNMHIGLEDLGLHIVLNLNNMFLPLNSMIVYYLLHVQLLQEISKLKIFKIK